MGVEMQGRFACARSGSAAPPTELGERLQGGAEPHHARNRADSGCVGIARSELGAEKHHYGGTVCSRGDGQRGL